MIEPLTTPVAKSPASPLVRPPTSRSGMRKWVLRFVILAVLGAVGAAASVVAQGQKENPPASEVKDSPSQRGSKPVTVTVEPVAARSVQRKVLVVGTMVGREEITVTAKVEGQISRINFDLGDVVKPGDTLVKIDDTDYKLAVAEAQRAVELELAKLGLKDLPADNFDVTQLPAVVKAVAQERSAAARFDRVKKARSSGVGSDDDYTLAEADQKVAVANYHQAILDARTTIATIRQKKAVLDTARQRLADTNVAVPIICAQPIPVVGPGGKPIYLPPISRLSVSRRMISEGEMLRVSPSTSMSVFKLVVDDYLKLGATVPERYLDEVKVGQEADIDIEAHPGQVFKGLVIRMNPTVDPANRTFQIVIGVPNPAGKLRAGCFAKAAISTRVDPSAVTVPEESLVSFAGVNKVFVVEGDHAREVHVTTGVHIDVGTERWIEVTGVLKPRAMVVTSGQSQLSEGKRVRVRNGK